MNVNLSREIQELELEQADLDQAERDLLILEKSTEFAEQAVREVARQLALVARVDVDIFTEAVVARTLAVACERRAVDLSQRVLTFRLAPQ
jgi:hypothetical protein